MRIILRILAVVALVISVVWLYFEQDYEPALTAVVSLSALISTFFFGQKEAHNKAQNQNVGDKSSAIQAGCDISVSIGNNDNKNRKC